MQLLINYSIVYLEYKYLVYISHFIYLLSNSINIHIMFYFYKIVESISYQDYIQ